MPPVPNPSIFYENPFASVGPADDDSPMSWYGQHPRAGALTIGLHTFNMLDQDLLFTYSRDLDPWYRIPLGIATHALVFCALIGIVMLVRRARTDGNCALAAITVLLSSSLTSHCTRQPRRDAVRLAVARPRSFPLRSHAIRELARASDGTRVFAASAVICYTAAALMLSDW
jgi:hypothetical protein